MSDHPDLLGFSNQALEQLAQTQSPREKASAVGSDKSTGLYKQGTSRYQCSGLGLCLDDRVDEKSVVRIIDLFVDQLNLNELGFSRANRGETAGQPPYDPGCLLKLYLYGYQNQVRSGRRLARECRVNLEVMWLLEERSPRYRTINNFRSDNSEALVAAHAKFLLLSRQWGLIGGSRISVDGSHFKGNVSAKSFITSKGLKKKQTQAQAEAAHWQAVLEQEEDNESTDSAQSLDLDQVKDRLQELDATLSQTQAQLDELSEQGRSQLSRTDADARLLRKRGKTTQGYNVQIATDHKHYLIVGNKASSDGNDLHQLHPVAREVKQRFGLTALEVIADKGYYSAEGIRRCIADQITPYVSIPDSSRRRERDRGYEREAFVYDESKDVYRCPAGEELRKIGQAKPRYRNRKACQECEYRDRCLSGKQSYREIYPIIQEQVLVEHAQRMAQSESIYAERKSAVEHPFGTLKTRAGYSHFLLRGHRKVTGELNLMCLSYNLTRVLNVLGFDRFKAILKSLIRHIYALKNALYRALLNLEGHEKLSPLKIGH